jgi:thiamine pyrophosphate-dependent acetolactate synthase large subunit-like protein
MAVVLVVQGPGLTRKQYEDSITKISTSGRVESPADWPVEGLLAHIAGEGPEGFRVVDVWESEDAVRRFGEMLGPVLADLGVDAQPEIYPAHTFVSA